METLGTFALTMIVLAVIVYISTYLSEQSKILQKDFEYYKSASPTFFSRSSGYTILNNKRQIKKLLENLRHTPVVREEVLAYEARLQGYQNQEGRRNIFLFSHLEIFYKCFIAEASKKDISAFKLPKDVFLDRLGNELDSPKLIDKFITEGIEVWALRENKKSYTFNSWEISHPYKKDKYNRAIKYHLDETSTINEVKEFIN